MWSPEQSSWIQSSEDINPTELIYRLNDLKPGTYYSISVDDKIIKKLKSNADGTLMFTYEIDSNPNKIVVATSKP